jgi:hypothetical protein
MARRLLSAEIIVHLVTAVAEGRPCLFAEIGYASLAFLKIVVNSLLA